MTTMLVRLQGLRSHSLRWLETLAWLAPLLARVTVGVVFMTTGWGKVHNLGKVAAFFAELKIPAPGFNAGLVAWVELIGGGLLLLGLLSRIAAVPLVITMTVAIWTAKASEIGGLPDLFGQIEWAYLVLLAWIALAGPGKASLDHALFSRSARFSRASKATETPAGDTGPSSHHETHAY